jgi:hypothetical protein
MMNLPFRGIRKNMIRVGSALLCAVVIALATPGAANAWDGGTGWHHGHEWHYRHGGWAWGRWYGPAFVAPPLPSFGVGVYPGYPGYYYPTPYPYYGPPAYVPAPPTVGFGFTFGR